MIISINNAPKDCIRTHSGLYVNVFDPKPEMFVIEDIAHALSHECRFAGHTPRFYSVAQHSVLCMEHASYENKLLALMHDASEAYLKDIPTPIKARLAGYKEIEHNLMLAIADKFGFNYDMNGQVKGIDLHMLHYEWEMLIIKNDPSFKTLTSKQAKLNFLKAFKELKY